LLAIDFWHGCLDTNPDQYQQHWRVLDENEQTQAVKFASQLLQQRYVTAHGKLRDILAKTLAVSATSIQIQKTAYGKPYLTDYPELAFNLSHTDNYMAVALAKNCQLGVDIEQCKHRSTLAALVQKCFSVEEADYWQKLSAAEQTREFYQFWTRKEAFVKATGLGISLGLRDCVVNPNNPQKFLAVPASCGLISDWHSRDIALEEEMCAALVANKGIKSINIKTA
jgi:4'-phosphopantetheinyl transferase